MPVGEGFDPGPDILGFYPTETKGRFITAIIGAGFIGARLALKDLGGGMHGHKPLVHGGAVNGEGGNAD